MPRQCAICGKRGRMVWTLKKLRGKYNPTVKTRKHPNLQWVRLPVGWKAKGAGAPGAGERVKACARCIKKLGV